jgi:hypothetical protein
LNCIDSMALAFYRLVRKINDIPANVVIGKFLWLKKFAVNIATINLENSYDEWFLHIFKTPVARQIASNITIHGEQRFVRIADFGRQDWLP